MKKFSSLLFALVLSLAMSISVFAAPASKSAGIHTSEVKVAYVGEHKISYTVHNPAKFNRSIFLIHGAGANSVSTDSLAAELELKFAKSQIVQIDLPAHGKSVGPIVPSIYDMATIVNEVIQQGRASGEFANRFTVAGISMGGSVTQTLAARNVDGLEKVVLIGTSPEWSHFSAMADWTPEFFAAVYPSMIEPDFAVNTTPEQQAWFHEWFPSTMCAPETSIGDVKALLGFNIINDLGKITKKTLIIHGDADQTAPYANAQILASKIKKSTLITVAGETHTYSMKQPSVVAQYIYDFVK